MREFSTGSSSSSNPKGRSRQETDAQIQSRIKQDREDGYDIFERMVSARVATAPPVLFTTSVEDSLVEDSLVEDSLFYRFLSEIRPDRRQHYNCSCCRRFINTYGGLVTIDGSGQKHPVAWSEDISFSNYPVLFQKSVASMISRIRESVVTGVFYNPKNQWGTPKTGAWTHLSGVYPHAFRATALKNADQAMAEKLQDFGVLSHGLSEISLAQAEQAVQILRADALSRSEKTLGVAEWVLNLKRLITNARGARLTGERRKTVDNIIWVAVATAPPGFCHIRSTMISTLFDDLRNKSLSFKDVQARWESKMHPLKYQRAQAPPKEGTLIRANKIVEELNSRGSLRRKFATLEDVRGIIWASRLTLEKFNDLPRIEGEGAFDHLRHATTAKQVAKVVVPEVKMTWEKFKRDVLPSSEEIRIRTPAGEGPFFSFTTTADLSAPPILQWDIEGRRNPVSWYFYAYGGQAIAFNLLPATFYKVNVITKSPAHFNSNPEEMKHHTESVFFVIDGCKDSGKGCGLFSEQVRSEYHEIRSAIEAFYREYQLEGREQASAAGLGWHNSSTNATDRNGMWDCYLEVKCGTVMSHYHIDRWE